jgi:uncharacterized membrane protein YidH (DUF202 family)
MRNDESFGRPLRHAVAALERTALAWERTAVSLGAVGLLMVKVVDGGRATQAAGLVLVAMAASVVLVMVPLGYRRAQARVDPDVPERPFVAHDRWRPRVLLVTACAISIITIVVAADVWVAGAI